MCSDMAQLPNLIERNYFAMKTLEKSFILLLLFFFLIQLPLFAADKGNFTTTPKTNNGKKWRIGYYEGGEYLEYNEVLIATVKELMAMGWIEAEAIPPKQSTLPKELWNWLATKSKSKYIQFVDDAYYSAGWNDEIRKKMASDIISRLNQQKDIDLMVAMGTKAGQDLANNKHQTPTIGLDISDPLAAGIIKSVEYSGYDHIHARVDPSRYERQIRIFHDIIRFKRLGIAYKDTPDQKSIAAIDKIEKIAKERGFEIERCFIKPDLPIEKDEENVKQCFEELVKKADAIYVTSQRGINERTIAGLAQIINTARIPSFSQTSSKEVQYGLLLSISQVGFKYVGRFYAEIIAKIFNGAKPGLLNQLFEDPPKIAINLKTAEAIGYDPPVDVLGVADEIYQEISVPK